MRVARIAHAEALLRRRARELREEIVRSLHPADARGAGLADHRDETDDEAVAALAREIDAASVERDGAELRAVEEALRRIEAGTYGTCSECGEPIAPERLEAVPHAARCAPCESREERAAGHEAVPRL